MLFAVLVLAGVPQLQWQALSPGVEYRTFTFEPKTEHLVHVVRIDPERAELAFALRSESGGQTRTAARWLDEKKWVVGINAGMFKQDYLSNVGRLVDGDHVNQAELNEYKSVLVFGPKRKGLPRAQIIDVDAAGAKELLTQYASQLQNLRLIRGPGKNLWKKNGRSWSEAAIAQDNLGRLLFVFTRDGYEMTRWNELLLALPLQVVKAMHVEGGPEASLSIRGGGLKVDLCGSYETGFNANDDNAAQWAIPNVLGVRR